MNENVPTELVSNGEARRLEYDWYAGGVPANVRLGEHVYIDTSYGFAPFHSEHDPGLALGDASARTTARRSSSARTAALTWALTPC